MARDPDEGPLPITVPTDPERGMFGHLLLLDELHAAPSGTVARMSAGTQHANAYLTNPIHQFLPAGLRLDTAAALADDSIEAMESLTYRCQMRALFGPAYTARDVGGTPQFGICPECVEPPRRLIPLYTTLPMVEVCHDHRWLLQRACPHCRRPLAAFRDGQKAFSCVCGHTAWEDLPRVMPTPQQEAVQRQLFEIYAWLLTRLPPSLSQLAASITARPADDSFSGGYEADTHLPESLTPWAGAATLAGVASLLLTRRIDPTALDAVVPASTSFEGCLCFDCRAGPNAVRPLPSRFGRDLRYCRECGSVFSGDRIVLAFTFDHGDPDLDDSVVERAQAWAADCRARVRKAAFDMVEAGLRHPLGAIFRLAGIEEPFLLGSHGDLEREATLSLIGAYQSLERRAMRGGRPDRRPPSSLAGHDVAV